MKKRKPGARNRVRANGHARPVQVGLSCTTSTSDRNCAIDLPESGPKRKFIKNPDVDTSFLPDRELEEIDRIERELLSKQWLAEQDRIKGETIEITYSFWDGSGHRKVVEVKKGDDIAAFLGKCKAQFQELRATSVENLMYIKVSPHGVSQFRNDGS